MTISREVRKLVKDLRRMVRGNIELEEWHEDSAVAVAIRRACDLLEARYGAGKSKTKRRKA